jgi:hypothetical protein
MERRLKQFLAEEEHKNWPYLFSVEKYSQEHWKSLCRHHRVRTALMPQHYVRGVSAGAHTLATVPGLLDRGLLGVLA